MNALRNAFSKISSSLPSGGAPIGAGAKALLGLGAGAYVIRESIVVVNPGHLGIVYNRFGVDGGGISETKVCHEGINFVVPWFQRVVSYDCRVRPQLINSQSGSKDLQMVQISLRVLFKPNPTSLATMYRRLGTDFDERVLPSIVNEVSKAVVAQYNASELLTKRDQVSSKIQLDLKKRAADFNILLDDVSITHLAFSREYTAAVEAKQVAQQDAERAKYIVDKAIQEKRTIVVKAEGEAESARLIGEAISDNPAFVQLRRIDAAREVANTLSSSQNKVFLNSDNLLLSTLGDATNISTKSKRGFW
jgi:prohibitin 2